METLNRKFKDSGYFEDKNTSAIVSGALFIPTLDARFKPYDDILIVNLNSDNDVEVNVNDLSNQILPKANNLQLNQIVRILRLKNIGETTINANEIRIFYRYTGYRGEQLKQKASTGLNLGMQLIRTIKVFS